MELEIFVWNDQVAALIYLSKQPPTPHTHIYTFVFLLYTHIFLFDKLFIYNTPKKKKKNLVFLIKIMFDGDLL